MRVVVLLEKMVQKAQEWEEVAHKGISLWEFSQPLVQLILRWRRLEIDSWMGIIEEEQRTFERTELRDWLNVFGYMNAFFESNMTTAGSNEQDPSFNQDITETVFQWCDEYLQRSTWGNFPTRLHMLRVNLAILEKRIQNASSMRSDLNHDSSEGHHPSPDRFAPILRLLRGVLRFYDQFSPERSRELSKNIDSMKKTISSDVKLSRWDDKNYYLMKASVEKGHRVVAKATREFDSILRRPMSVFWQVPMKRELIGEYADPFASEDEKNTKIKKNVKKDKKKDKKKDEKREKVEEMEIEPARSLFETLSLRPSDMDQKHTNLICSSLPADVSFKRFHRLTSIVSRMHALWNSNAANGDGWLSAMISCTHDVCDSMSESVIRSVLELQKDRRPRTRPRKRRAFVDLLKECTRVGMDHRASSIPPNERNIPGWLSVMDAERDYHVSHDDYAILSKSKKYLFRAFHQFQTFRNHILPPAPDMLPTEQTKCEGIIRYLLHKTSTAFKISQEMDTHLDHLESLTLFLDSFSEPEIESSRAWRVATKTERTHIAANMDGIMELLENARAKTLHLLDHIHVLDASMHSATLKKAYELLKRHESVLQDDIHSLVVLNEWSSLDPRTPSLSWIRFGKDISEVARVTEHFDSFARSLDEFVEHQGKVSEFEQYQYDVENMRMSLSSLCQELKKEEYGQDDLPDEQGLDAIDLDFESLAQSLDDIMESAMICIQRMCVYSGHSPSMEEDRDGDDDKMNTGEDAAFEDDLVLQKWNTWMASLSSSSCWSFLYSRISKLILDVFPILWQRNDERDAHPWNTQSIAACLSTIIRPIVSMLRQLLSVQCHSTKSMSKLSLVLSSVFNNIRCRGFCIDEKSDQDEEDGDGEDNGDGKFEEMEGTGIGEGEGKKDVTDQIENEDQLVGSKPENQLENEMEKEKEDQSKKPEEEEEQDPEKGFEMEEHDFDGEFEDLEGPKEGEDREEWEEKKDQMEKQMGDVDNENADEIDEKVWNDEDENEGNGKEEEQQEEKDDDRLIGGEDDELRAKEDEDDKMDESKTDRDSDSQKQQQQQQQEGEEEQPEEGEDEDEKRKAAEYEDKVDADKNDVHPDTREEETFELPDDLDLDGADDEDNDDEDERPNDEELGAEDLQKMEEEDSGERNGDDKDEKEVGTALEMEAEEEDKGGEEGQEGKEEENIPMAPEMDVETNEDEKKRDDEKEGEGEGEGDEGEGDEDEDEEDDVTNGSYVGSADPEERLTHHKNKHQSPQQHFSFISSGIPSCFIHSFVSFSFSFSRSHQVFLIPLSFSASASHRHKTMSLLRSFAHVASIPSHSFGRFFTATIKRFRPLGDRVLVEKVEPKKKSVGGILLPDSAVPRANEGKVLEVGAGARTRDGQVVPMNVKPGDRVLLPEFGGLGVKFGDKEYFLYRDEDILGILIE
eukprot:TRINITY_DN678_c0_g2_i1.p1 TRINITY_DN678_c0_g2~~TRINITY_DN678_c0_g2_i1.p1  ORF type:complete len:1664 (-),score=628.01 TRINITY_DN678_c0_g2_i1:8506-12777(-)